MERTLRQCVENLAATGQLVRIDQEIDPELEAAEIQRRVFRAGGPAVFYARVKGCRFPMVSNLFGTKERVRYLFRDTLEVVRKLVKLKLDPADFWRHPWAYRDAPLAAWHARPRRLTTGPVLACETALDQLPRLKSWPGDGGAFITLPAVYSEDPDQPGMARSNLGMYRVQFTGGRFEPNREVGLHYQIHRGIGGHHAAAIRRGEPLPVNIFVGGTPAMSVAAVMPLPEAVSEIPLAGALAGHRIGMIFGRSPLPVYAEADFCLVGSIDPARQLPEGPFGDHLGYYSMAHDFPVMQVDRVYHRPDAIWPFTVVGRPPQEDAMFGQLVHELTRPAVPAVIPGVRAVHAVDAAGVHPLLLAIGSERYVPYRGRTRPQELLTLANAILGQGQLSLAKYLWIAAGEDDPALDVYCVTEFFVNVLQRVDWRRDLHFQTCTTIDTLDYTGSGLNEGSKVVIAATGPSQRTLPDRIEQPLGLPDGFREPRVCLPGILAVAGPPYRSDGARDTAIEAFCAAFSPSDPINRFPLVIVVDDSQLTSTSLENFLWVTFTRSNPAADVHGIASLVDQKHWGCAGSLVIDARIKPHHTPALVEDPEITRRVDALGAPGGPLHGII
ncbi:MAG: UbiD family decarboxylase [Pirellulales bacterium]